MADKKLVASFIDNKRLAVAGVSRNSKKFGNVVFRALREKGYDAIPVNPNAQQVEGQPCFSSIKEIQPVPPALLVVVPPEQALPVIEEAAWAGIKMVWLQQGAHSPEAVEACRKLGIDCVANECILMFAEPVQSIHKFHRWIWKVLGKLPN